MICTYCKKTIKDNAIYCPHCGSKQEKTTRTDFTASVNAALAGDQDAFAFLYEQSIRIFKREIMKFIHDEGQVEDTLQEVYLTIFEKLHTLQDPRTFLGWGIRICHTRSINKLKSRKEQWENVELRQMTSDESHVGLDQLSEDNFSLQQYSSEYNPEAYMEAAETRRLLDEILDALPLMQKTCILLWQQSYTTTEIATQLGIPTGTVKSNINYARKKVKAQVLLLAENGTKLYGMAPLPFFLWLLHMYDRMFTPVMPEAGSPASLECIMQAWHHLHMSGHLESFLAEGCNAGNQRIADSGCDSDTIRVDTADTNGLDANGKDVYGPDKSGNTGDGTNASGRNVLGSTLFRGSASILTKKGVVKVMIALIAVAVISIGGVALIKALHKTDQNTAGGQEMATAQDGPLVNDESETPAIQKKQNDEIKKIEDIEVEKEQGITVEQFMADNNLKYLDADSVIFPFIEENGIKTGIDGSSMPNSGVIAATSIHTNDGKKGYVIVSSNGYKTADEMSDQQAAITLKIVLYTLHDDNSIEDTYNLNVYTATRYMGNVRIDLFMDKDMNLYSEMYSSAVDTVIENSEIANKTTWSLIGADMLAGVVLIDITPDIEGSTGGLSIEWDTSNYLLLNNDSGPYMTPVGEADSSFSSTANRYLGELGKLPFKVQRIGKDSYDSILAQNDSLIPLARVESAFSLTGSHMDIEVNFENLTDDD